MDMFLKYIFAQYFLCWQENNTSVTITSKVPTTYNHYFQLLTHIIGSKQKTINIKRYVIMEIHLLTTHTAFARGHFLSQMITIFIDFFRNLIRVDKTTFVKTKKIYT